MDNLTKIKKGDLVMQLEENKYYSEKRKLGIDINKAKNPYLPDGFKHIDGNVENGFVIKDDDGNEFVWIPCTLDDNE